ncbi:MAG: hypothetical protein EOP45_02490 [Sphingobacteriaceae bacterium]|nr:MAG: hypothetical protein EOP45_02490 [Sphingobacteriaceae bacterium]
MTDNPNYYFIERPYKSKYICITCRKSFKRRLLIDILPNKDIEEKEPTCPDCGNLTNFVGPKFRAPKMENLKAWNSIKVLHDIGILNFIGFTNNYISIPETTKSLKDFLEDLKARYEGNIKRWTTIEYSPGNKNQIQYFSNAIQKIEKHLQKK